jgi:hypothetical protein
MPKKKRQSMRRAAKEVSEIMAASLEQFSQAEQNQRLKAIHKIAEAVVMPKRNLSKERAAGMLADLAMKHLAKYPAAEQDARISAFRRKVSTLKKTSAK